MPNVHATLAIRLATAYLVGILIGVSGLVPELPRGKPAPAATAVAAR